MSRTCELTVILYAFASLESRRTLIGLGALPARVRLKMVLTGGGARRSDAIELVLDDELCVLLGDGACIYPNE